MASPVLVGAVLYDPKVSIIWDIIGEFFEAQGCPIDVVFYTNYELQVRALAEGHIDMAWNSPLAWLDSVRLLDGKCRAIAMRDTDRDRVTHIVVPVDSPAQVLEDLRGKTVAVGAKDSPQATLIPLGQFQEAGLEPGEDFQVRRFDLLVGKHGDHIGGELQAFRCMAAGEADASCMLDLNWQAWTADGSVDKDAYRILATTPTFDHCVFTVRSDFDPELEKKWLAALFAMSYENPEHREMMDMEGLKAWQPGRTSGFGPLQAAVRRQQYFEGAPS